MKAWTVRMPVELMDWLRVKAAKETIKKKVRVQGKHKKQSGGSGQFGEVHIRMMPFPRGTDPEEFCVKARFPQMKNVHHHEEHNFVWVDSVVGGVIPSNFMPAVEKGFMDRLNRGVIAGYQIQDVLVEVHFGKHHPVDSKEVAFVAAGKRAHLSDDRGRRRRPVAVQFLALLAPAGGP